MALKIYRFYLLKEVNAMYFVDRQRIEDTLIFLEQQIHLFKTIDSFEDGVKKAALERMAFVIIESVLDVGNAMIDGFIMRDPGSFDDIIDILLDEKVITEEMSNQFKDTLAIRKNLVQFYTSINHQELFETMTKNLNAFEQYPEKIRTYLENELGPVSAFKN